MYIIKKCYFYLKKYSFNLMTHEDNSEINIPLLIAKIRTKFINLYGRARTSDKLDKSN